MTKGKKEITIESKGEIRVLDRGGGLRKGVERERQRHREKDRERQREIEKDR